MMISMFSGVTGLRNHQTRMDVIGNNIANVNTVAFKASRVIFQDMFSQTIKDAAGAAGGLGGNNANQVGVGMSLANIDILHTRTSAQYTGAPLDASIEGEGYFVVNTGGGYNYTRAGNFYVIGDKLLDSNGYHVMGFPKNTAGDGPDLTATLTDITVSDDYYNVSVNSNGEIQGLDNTTNEKVILGYVALANFNNNNGLEKVGNNLYRQSASSGDATFAQPGDGGVGQLAPGMLEMSNVDLANEFTNMIITQRGFQANSRIITTSDQMLEELVNIKR